MPQRRTTDFPISPRQQDVLDCITRYWFTNGIPATIRELGEMLGITSPNGVMAHLRPLVAKRYVRVLKVAGNGLKRTVYAPFHPELRAERASGSAVRVGTIGGAVTFTRAEWVRWLRAELRRQGAR